jgi:hypothetical protein
LYSDGDEEMSARKEMCVLVGKINKKKKKKCCLQEEYYTVNISTLVTAMLLEAAYLLPNIGKFC